MYEGILVTEQDTDYGKSLDSAVMERGLRELNPDISFDWPNNLSHANFVMTQVPNFESVNANRKGVYYNGYYICSMDRGIVTEVPVTEMELGHKDIPATDIDKYDEVMTMYVEVLPDDPNYNESLLKAQKRDDQYVLDDDGKIFRYRHIILAMVPGRVIRVGWRSTFAALVAANIPGITIKSLEDKFGIDLRKAPN